MRAEGWHLRYGEKFGKSATAGAGEWGY